MIAEKMKTKKYLLSHPKVLLMARHLPVTPDSEGQISHSVKQKGCVREKCEITVACLLQFWTIAKHHARKGVIPDADLSYIDAIVNHPGFGQAMEKAGWVKYDKRRNCLLLPEMKGEQLKSEVRKSKAALRQQRYRMRLKVRNWIVEGKKAAAELVNNSRIKNQDVVITHDVAYDEEGSLLKFGSITIDGKTMHVGYGSPQHKATDKHGRPSWVSDVSTCYSRVTHSVTDSVTPVDSGVTPDATNSVTHSSSGVTPEIAKSVTNAVSNGTQRALESVTVGDSGVIPGIAKSVTVGDFGVTRSVTQPVPHGDSGVTQSVTDSATLGVLDVTQGVTHRVPLVDSGVTDHIPGGLSRVIPSRARTRFSFLRSKRLRSKHKTTHSARAKIFTAAMRFNNKTAQNQHPSWPEHTNPPRRTSVSLAEPINYPQTFDALLNVNQSVTLWRNGFSATCVTRKPAIPPAHRSWTNHPVQSKKFRLDSSWIPSEKFLENAKYIGIKLTHEATDFEIAEFVDYWVEEGAQHTQKQWETKLARFIGKGRKRTSSKPPRRQDFTVVSSTDYAIPEGFHGG